MKDFQSLIQLLAAIYFSFCFEGLSNKLFKITGNTRDLYRSIVQSNRLNSLDSITTISEKMIRIDSAVVKYSARFGLILCVLFLFITGTNTTLPITPWMKENWIFVILLIAFPLLPSIAFLQRPMKWMSRLNQKLSFINKKQSEYLSYVAKGQHDQIDNNSLKNTLLHNSNNKGISEYFDEVSQWGFNEKERVINKRKKKIIISHFVK